MKTDQAPKRTAIQVSEKNNERSDVGALERLALAIAKFCTVKPAPVLAIVIIATIVASLFVVGNLSTSSPYFLTRKTENEPLNSMPEAIVVVEGDKDRVAQSLDALAEELASRPKYFKLEPNGLDAESLTNKRLYSLNAADASEVLRLAEIAKNVGADRWDDFALDAWCDRLATDIQESADGAVDAALVYLKSLAVALDPKVASFDLVPKPIEAGAEQRLREKSAKPYVAIEDGRVGVLPVELRTEKRGVGGGDRDALERLREVVDAASAARPDVKFGIVGLPELERDSLLAGARARVRLIVAFAIAALVVVALVFMRPLHSFFVILTHLILAAWILGFVALTFGRLSASCWVALALSEALCCVLSCFYLSRYASTRLAERSVSEAVLSVSRTTGVEAFGASFVLWLVALGVLSGRTRPFVELGSTLAFGALAVLLLMFFFLPTCIAAVDSARPLRRSEPPLDLVVFRGAFDKHSRVFLWIGAIVAILAIAGLYRTSVELGDFSVDAESARLEKLATKALDRGLWSAISVAEPQTDLNARKAAFETEPTVKAFSYLQIVPKPTIDEQRAVQSLADALALLKPELGTLPEVKNDALNESLTNATTALRSRLDLRDDAKAAELSVAIKNVRDALADESATGTEQRLASFQRLTAIETLKRLFTLREIADPEPPKPDDLSQDLGDRWFDAESGAPILKIYSTERLDSVAKLRAFVASVHSIDPSAGGVAVSLLNAITIARERLIVASLVALFATIVGLIVAFHSFRALLYALGTPILALAISLGVLAWLGSPFVAQSEFAIALVALIGVFFGGAVARDVRTTDRPSASTAIAIATVALIGACAFSGAFLFVDRAWNAFARLGVLGVLVAALVALLLPVALERDEKDAVEEKTTDAAAEVGETVEKKSKWFK